MPHSWSCPEEEEISLKYLFSRIILLFLRQITTKLKLNFRRDNQRNLPPTPSSGKFIPTRQQGLSGEPASCLFYFQYTDNFANSAHSPAIVCKSTFKWASMKSFLTLFFKSVFRTILPLHNLTARSTFNLHNNPHCSPLSTLKFSRNQRTEQNQ